MMRIKPCIPRRNKAPAHQRVQCPFFSSMNNPVSADKIFYQQVGLTMTPDLQMKGLEQMTVEAHERYKLEYSHNNPTLESMVVDRELYLSPPGARKYKNYLEEMLKEKIE